jgi:hypothetical protein
MWPERQPKSKNNRDAHLLCICRDQKRAFGGSFHQIGRSCQLKQAFPPLVTHLRALVATAGLIDFLGNRFIRAQPPAWPHFIGNAIALTIAMVNMLIHSGDAWTSVVPT